MWNKDVNKAAQDHSWPGGERRKKGWGEMTHQHRQLILKGKNEPKQKRLRLRRKSK